jgi:hypothetical protein
LVIEKAELRRMSQAERRELAAMLAELEASQPDQARVGQYRADPYRIDPVLRRERRLALLVSAACCVFLAGWIVLLAATLPHHFDAHHWRAVWVNFDVFLLAAFAVTAWAIWRQRQVLILLLMLIGTMLCCDAWFDVGTSLATSGLWISLLSAVFAELPLAFLAFAGARRRHGRRRHPGRRVGPELCGSVPATRAAGRPRARRGPAAPPRRDRPPGGLTCRWLARPVPGAEWLGDH